MRTRHIFLFSIFLFCIPDARATDPALQLIKTIPLTGVEGRFDHLSVDVKGKRLFVAALGNNSVEVFDLEKGERVQSIKGLKEPQGLRYVPESNRLFVACGGDGSCRIYDGQSFKLITKIDLGDDADNVRYDA